MKTFAERLEKKTCKRCHTVKRILETKTICVKCEDETRVDQQAQALCLYGLTKEGVRHAMP